MRFAGYEVEKKRLHRTVATRKPDEIAGLGKSKRPRVCGCDLHNNLTSFRGVIQITSRF